MARFDMLIVGAGIVGAATAWQLQQRYPNKKILLIEKEKSPASHQTGRNSGVIHAGVYYQPGSLKAEFCRRGVDATIQFCRDYKLPYSQCGKLIVATSDKELKRMESLFHRCQQNGLQPQWLDQAQLKRREKNIRGLGAFYVQQTGITDYAAITQTMLKLFQQGGGQIVYGETIEQIQEQGQYVEVRTQVSRFYGLGLINCSGLMADRLIRMMGLQPDFRIVPFRGEYFRLPPEHNHIVNHLIYPVPNPRLPFLGVHLTRMIDGSVTVGPNAVLSLAREGYEKHAMNLTDIKDMCSFRGFWPLMTRYAGNGLKELRNSWFKQGYLRQVQKYCPSVKLEDLLPHPSGIRAQAVSNTGQLIHDFKFVETPRSLHVGNAPSPAATSAIPIAEAIVDKVEHLMA